MSHTTNPKHGHNVDVQRQQQAQGQRLVTSSRDRNSSQLLDINICKYVHTFAAAWVIS